MPTNRTATGRWKRLRRELIAAAEREGRLQCAICRKQLDSSAPANTDNAVEIDHVVPVAIDPSLEWEPTNHQILCHPCNRRKSAGFAKPLQIRRSGALVRPDCNGQIPCSCPAAECCRNRAGKAAAATRAMLDAAAA